MSTEFEWSYPYRAEHITHEALKLEIEADAQSRAHIARRIDVVALEGLSATLTLQRQDSGQVIHIRGALRAKVTQKCVVSDAPVETALEEEFEAWFTDPQEAVSIEKVRRDKQRSQSHGEMRMVEEHEDPEMIIDGSIDLGELVAQHLLLALPPYPHAKGVAYEHGDDLLPKGSAIPNPFAKLKDWKDKL